MIEILLKIFEILTLMLNILTESIEISAKILDALNVGYVDGNVRDFHQNVRF